MTVHQQALTICPMLLAVPLVFTGHAAAQASPGGLTALHSFAGYPSDGADPFAAVVIGSGRVLYGTTQLGGTSNLGTLFSLTPPTSPGGAWTETVLHSFGSTADGAHPQAGVVIGIGGVLYGTTAEGGIQGGGTVFSLTPPTSPGGVWAEAVLYNFAGGISGKYPSAGVAIGRGGVLYGSAEYGGTSTACGIPPLTPGGCGTVFSLTPPLTPGGSWAETVIHNFTRSDGAWPNAVAIGKNGVLYGTAGVGGTRDAGIVFSLKPPTAPGGAWRETVLHNLAGGSDGAYPLAGVVIGRGGVLYGTTYQGGTSTACGGFGCGTVFSLTPPTAPGGPWTETVIHNFTGAPSDGYLPAAGVAIGKGAVLYGSTVYGGTSNAGTVFSLTPPTSPGAAWREGVLYNFTGGSHGSYPNAGMVIGSRGVLYGTTVNGGTSNFGTLFRLNP